MCAACVNFCIHHPAVPTCHFQRGAREVWFTNHQYQPRSSANIPTAHCTVASGPPTWTSSGLFTLFNGNKCISGHLFIQECGCALSRYEHHQQQHNHHTECASKFSQVACQNSICIHQPSHKRMISRTKLRENHCIRLHRRSSRRCTVCKRRTH